MIKSLEPCLRMTPAKPGVVQRAPLMAFARDAWLSCATYYCAQRVLISVHQQRGQLGLRLSEHFQNLFRNVLR